MKKFLSVLMALLAISGIFTFSACENLEGGNGGVECQHVIGEDGVCELCQKDILEKWQTIFGSLKDYEVFADKEYTIIEKQTVRQQNNDGEFETRWMKIVSEFEKNKFHSKAVETNQDWQFLTMVYEDYYYYYFDEINQSIINYDRHGSNEQWYKDEGQYSTYVVEMLNMQYGFFRIVMTFENMLPEKIEYKDETFEITYKLYEITTCVLTVKNDIVTNLYFETIYSEDSFIKQDMEVIYGEVNIVLPVV